ncbi:MAG: fimbrial assembly protein, partial [Methylococcales bacterium]
MNLDIRCFFFWWGSELAFLVPEKCRQFFSEKSDTVILTVLENSYEIARYNDGQIRVIADLKRNEQG